MATTSYTVYSHYDPDKDKKRLQLETGQAPDIDTDANKKPDDDDKLWREAASASFLRAQRPPPRFVPATISYSFDSDAGPSTPKHTTSSSSLGTSLSSWYRSLAIANDSDPSSHQPRPSSAPVASSSSVEESKESKKRRNRMKIKKNKNNWFIQKFLQSEPSSAPSTPPPTLADILARDPPPLPSEPKYHPPVWLEIGPSNKGFAMLRKGGWNEGEALGVGGGRGGSRRSYTQSSSTSTTTSYLDKGKHKTRDTEVTMMKFEKEWERQDGHGPSDVRVEKIINDVIDLTLTDSESETEEDDDDIAVKKEEEEFAEAHEERIRITSRTEGAIDNSHGGTALLTPIATVLKLDRLGIGFKAKREGPHKASVKRVTHHAAALNAHKKAAQEARKRREKFGRGRRGYERQKRGEEERRRNLIAYMKS